jgi:uncharacterized protein (TIGR02996 family)
MSDEKALLAAIWEHPYEDAPRLVYADWLDENAASDADRARAEFIRIQCERARLDEDAPESVPLLEREVQLLEAHRNLWLEALPRAVQFYGPFERGFPYLSLGRELSTIQLEKVPKRHVQAAPLWEVGVRAGNSDRLVPLSSVANLRRIGRLSLRGADHRGELLAALDPSAATGNVGELNWVASDSGGEVFHALARPEVLPQVQRLRVHAALDERAAAALAGSPLAGRLTRLAVPLTGATARALFATNTFARLTDLDVVVDRSGGLLPGGRYAVVNTRGFVPTRDGDAFIEALIACGPPGLRRLRYREGGITTEGAEALAGWAGARSLRRLDLRAMSVSHDVGTAGVRALIESPHLGGLVSLTVNVSGSTRGEITRLLLDRFGTLVPPPDSTPYWITGGVEWPEPVWW